MLLESKAAVGRALHYLAERQKPNGSWQDQPAITALVVSGMLGSGQEGFGAKGEVVSKALNYIRGFAKPDGGIYDKSYAIYSTCVCVTALAQANLPEDADLISRTRAYLLDMQADEGEGFGRQDTQYGGWGYERNTPQAGGTPRRCDLSNTQFALEAIKNLQDLCEQTKAPAAAGAAAAGADLTARTDLAYQHAILYLQRCQNLKTTNDQPWAANDGGFVYGPGLSPAGQTAEGGLRSYGSMTYAGFKSMIYAKLAKDDPRVVAAWQWAQMNWTVAENPGLGQEGLFYYYLTMSRALDVYGAEQVVDAKSVAHDWRAELVGQLLSSQASDGSWKNPNSRWMESIPELVTAYSVMAMEYSTAGW
jgi:squalene-hopene/tetraprenyl-beta-curcumene cyclase